MKKDEESIFSEEFMSDLYNKVDQAMNKDMGKEDYTGLVIGLTIGIGLLSFGLLIMWMF